MSLVIDFCGETFAADPDRAFAIGREGDLVVDDRNAFLHRRFLVITRENDLWWLSNTGTTLAATVGDPHGLFQAWLSPGARLPLTMPRSTVAFTAGSTSYEIDLLLEDAPFAESFPVTDLQGSTDTTMGRVSMSPEQHLLVLVLCEPRLRAESRGPSVLPTAAEAAERLGWTVTKFNRKLDAVCQKLSRLGVRGLHGDSQRLAANRRARLVEYALLTRLVSPSDLVLLNALDVES